MASIRRAAFASCVRAAASRRSAAETSNRVITTAIAAPSIRRGLRITPGRAAPTHSRVNGFGGWYNKEHEADIEIRQVKYSNNIVEQDHRAIKRAVRPMLGFKSFWSAAITLAGIELMHMIRKGQLKAAGKLRPAPRWCANGRKTLWASRVKRLLGRWDGLVRWSARARRLVVWTTHALQVQ